MKAAYDLAATLSVLFSSNVLADFSHASSHEAAAQLKCFNRDAGVNDSYEKKTLEEALQFIEEPESFRRHARLSVFMFQSIAAALIIVAFLSALLGVWPATWSIVLGMVGGIFSGAAITTSISARTWGAVSPHIDKNSLSRRLLEIEA